MHWRFIVAAFHGGKAGADEPRTAKTQTKGPGDFKQIYLYMTLLYRTDYGLS